MHNEPQCKETIPSDRQQNAVSDDEMLKATSTTCKPLATE